jgi:colicin import membrane protein
MQQLRAELEQVRADAEAVIAAARERATAAEARAQQRASERAAATEAAAADAEVARAFAAAEDAIRQVQAQAARTSSMQSLSIPVPPFEFRSETGHIESALNALQQIDYVLEVGMAEDGDAGIPLDIDMTQTLVWAVQEHARYLADESPSAAGRMSQPPGDAAAAYREAAAPSFRALLQRIETVTRQLAGRDLGPYTGT